MKTISISLIVLSLLAPLSIFAGPFDIGTSRVGSVFYCACSQTWQITFAGPTYGTFDYIPFSQMFSSYNIPKSMQILGKYKPAGPICYIPAGYGCVPVYSRGLITPFVGSSPI